MKQVLVGSIVCVITLIFLNVFGNENDLKITDELLTKENDMVEETKLTVGALTSDIKAAYIESLDNTPFIASILQPNYEPGSYVGIYIDLDGSVDYLKLAVASSNAKEKVEVRVAFDGIAKDFTFDEFFNRLGFDAETNP